MVLEKGIANRKYQSYFDIGNDKTAVRVSDVTVSSNKLSITGETITLNGGTSGVFTFDKAPVYNNDGSKIGASGDTSIVFTSGTPISTEVAYNQLQEDSEQFDAMSSGDFAVDYDLGRVRWKKVAGTGTMVASYSSRQLNVELTAGTSTISIGTVKIEDAADSTIRLNVLTQDSAFGTTTKGVAIFGKYEATPTSYADGDAAPILLDANGRVVLSSDIEIGAVEIKDGVSDNRAFIQSSGTAKNSSTNALVVQHVDSTGSSMPSGSTVGNPIHIKLTDGTDVADVIIQDGAFGTASKGLPLFGKYEATPTTYSDGDAAPVLLDSNGRVVLSADIEIGAVELKDGVSDNRAFIQSAGTSKSSTTNALIVQHVDSTGSSMPSGSTVGNPIHIKLTDGTDVADVLIQDDAFGTAAKGLPLFGKYQSSPTTYSDGDAAPVLLDSNGRIVLSADIEIGAVELKDGVSDNRAFIDAAGTSVSSSSKVLFVQHIDSTGSSAPSGAANNKAVFVRLTDSTDNAGVLSNGALQVDLLTVSGGTSLATNAGAATAGTLRVAVANDVTIGLTSGSAQALGVLSSGSANYVTVLTSSAARNHLKISLLGEFDAYVSLDGGSTDHLNVSANSVEILDNITIPNGVAIKAKNAVSGSSHGKLAMTVW